ncbi:hypothetical protein TNCV_3999671 [Trichonephila clavipes]|nr:hypothetical protein TNCV_3999671 [Trichonephila clavipes]
MPKEVEELVFVWASRLSPYPWVRFDYPFPFVIRSKNRGELQCLLKQPIESFLTSCLYPIAVLLFQPAFFPPKFSEAHLLDSDVIPLPTSAIQLDCLTSTTNQEALSLHPGLPTNQATSYIFDKGYGGYFLIQTLVTLIGPCMRVNS